jgi:DNA-binding transcriptional regulator GbsR (MarR family)
MSSYWGISRTMAEIHALMYVSTEPLCTDDVMEQLQISRGNASMNLRALVDWSLITRVHRKGDRKEYFVCEADVWQMFETITRQRKRREVEPIVETIERCRAMVPVKTHRGQDADAYRERLDNMLAFLNAISAVFNLILRLGRPGLSRVTKMLGQLAK